MAQNKIVSLTKVKTVPCSACNGTGNNGKCRACGGTGTATDWN